LLHIKDFQKDSRQQGLHGEWAECTRSDRTRQRCNPDISLDENFSMGKSDASYAFSFQCAEYGRCQLACS